MGQLGWRRIRKIVPANTSVPRGRSYRSLTLQHALKVVDKCPSLKAQVLYKLLPLCWVQEWVRLSVGQSYRPPALLKLSPTDFQSQILRELTFLVHILEGRRCSMWTLTSLQEGPPHLWYLSHLWDGVLGVWVPTRLPLCPYSSWCGFFFISLAVLKLFW